MARNAPPERSYRRGRHRRSRYRPSVGTCRRRAGVVADIRRSDPSASDSSREHEVAGGLEPALGRLLETAPNHPVECWTRRHGGSRDRADAPSRSRGAFLFDCRRRTRAAPTPSRRGRSRTKRCRTGCRSALRAPVRRHVADGPEQHALLGLRRARRVLTLAPWASVASPKSSSFTWPSRVTKMFSGLRSRWMMPRSWAAARPRRSERHIPRPSKARRRGADA